MNNITSRKLSITFGLTFIAVGILGFLPNPIVAASGLFAVNTMHNLVHLMTGGAFLIGGALSEDAALRTLKAIGLAYVGVTILGFLTDGHLLLGLVHINEADRWLHAGLALVILAAGYGAPRLRTTRTSVVWN